MMRNVLSTLLALTIVFTSVAFVAGSAVVSSEASATALSGGWYKARARTRDGQTKVDARYRDRDRDGTTEQRLIYKIERAQPNTSYDVKFNGQTLGQIHTNSLGRGKIKWRTPEFIDDPDWLPIPANFPRVVNGDRATIGSLTAEFRVDD